MCQYQTCTIPTFFSVNYFGSFSPSFFISSNFGVSAMPFLNPLMAFPSPSPIWGSFPTPKIMRIMARITSNSDIPRPNILCLLPDLFLQLCLYFILVYMERQGFSYPIVFTNRHTRQKHFLS